MYQKRTMPVPAIKWTGDNFKEIKGFCKDENSNEMCFLNGKTLWINNGKKQVRAEIGDFIIKEIYGTFYPISQSQLNDLFDEVIEPKVDSSPSITSLADSASIMNVIPSRPATDISAVRYEGQLPKTNPAKSLHNTDSDGAKKNVKDIVFFGDGDTFKLISKASSEKEGWMKSTKAMEIVGVGCVVQTTTQQRNPDGSYSLTDAVTFVPNCGISETKNDEEVVISRKLVKVANY